MMVLTVSCSFFLVIRRRYEISPVCADLQGQILNCYRENAGKTLLCANLASLYLQCVTSAKQVSVCLCVRAYSDHLCFYIPL